MQEQTHTTDVDQEESGKPDFDRFASYEDGDDIVICDRKNPKAWIKSDKVTQTDC